MSVENLYLRCTTKRKNIQHATTPQEGEELGQKDAGEGQEDEDSFKRKQQTAVRHLRVILAYLKDFTSITDTLKKDQKATQKKGLQQSMEPAQMSQPQFVKEVDKGSHAGSGSQGNTRELPKR